MGQQSGPIRPEDYIEPVCLLNCGPGRNVQSVPQQRIMDKLDEYMQHRDFPGAERHLLYWREEARAGKDLQGQLLVANEMIGFYRKTDDEDKAFSAISEALDLLDALGFAYNVSAGTTFVNAATAYSAFGKPDEALRLFIRARSIYESREDTPPELLGGLYNNMGLACTALGRYPEAHSLYALALEKMALVRDGELEKAITYLNIADALDAEQGEAADEAQLGRLMAKARQCLMRPGIERSGYYAFVCEKCAPGFRYYGDEETAGQLERLAEQIYAGT